MNPRSSPYPVSGLQSSRSPRPSTGAWSAEDDEILMNARAQQLRWAPLAQKHFPDKTGNACRKRHERLMEKNGEEKWDGGKIEMLAREYTKIRPEMWQMLATRVGEKWQTVEAKVSMLDHNGTYRVTKKVVYGKRVEVSPIGSTHERQ